MEDPTLPRQCVAIGKRSSSTNQVIGEILANPRRWLLEYTRVYISRARVCVSRVHKVSFRAAVYTRCVPRILVPASTRRKPLAEVNTQRVLFQASCSYGVGVVLRIRDKEKRFFEFSRAFSSFLSVLRQASYKGSRETIASFN